MPSGFENVMDYEEVLKMSRLFSEAASQLDDTIKKVQQIANQLDENALQGKAGTALVDAINTDLVGSLKRFMEKMTQMSEKLKRDQEKQQALDEKNAEKIRGG